LRTVLLLLLLLQTALLPLLARADGFEDEKGTVQDWTARLDDPRAVVDQVVVCFDGSSFLREIGRWDESRYWPVLLWDSDLVPKFIAAFRPRTVRVARIDEKGTADLATARRAVAEAWGVDAPADLAPDAAAFLEVLRKRDRTPMGAVLLAEGSPELLGGAALAAGRFHLPLVFTTTEKRDVRLKAERTYEIRKELAAALDTLHVDFDEKFDDLDFITVANDLPFAYDAPDGDAHPGRYTVDDALARNDDLERWGWVGRFTGGPARSVFMAMGALFLQPEKGLFFSRYNPKNATFGVFSPRDAVPIFETLFPTESIEHPDATLARWREVEWPGGNPYGFLYVNSSGGATSWSTSKGKGTHFDIPDTSPAVVHYTHSGSAGSPFNIDTIAGRWLARGAYVYFGSHAEPYLQAFIPPSTLAKRVREKIPLGAAMRLLYSSFHGGQREMKVGGEKKLVRFNMSGPWKLAYFGDPSYRLTGARPERTAPSPKPGPTTYRTLKAYLKLKPKTEARRALHDVQALGAVRLDPKWRKLVDASAWRKLLKKDPEGEQASLLLREMTRRWVAALRREGPDALYDTHRTAKLSKTPDAISRLLSRGVQDDEASRCLIEFAKSTIEGLAAHPDSTVGKARAEARWVLIPALRFHPPKGIAKPFFAWVLESCKALGVDKARLKAETLKPAWVPEKVRKAVGAALK